MKNTRDRRLGAVFAIGFSLVCWFAVLHFFVSCEAVRRETGLIETLEAADRGRDLLAAAARLAQPATAAATIDGGVPQDDRVLTVHPPCGSGVRPYLWVTGRPRLGGILKITADPYGAPRGVDGDLYDWRWVYLLAEFREPRRTPIPLPDGCQLWIDPDSATALVWSLGNRPGYQDALVSVDPDGRLIRVRQEIPRLQAIAGRRVWVQLLAVDGNEWKTSQTIELVFGRPF